MALFGRDPYFQSFAQSGEDSIVWHLLRSMKVNKPYYVDIGAYHPVKFSNTFAMYLKGGHGLCVEANPRLCELFRRKRPLDQCLNYAVTSEYEGEVDFYILEPDTLSTLDATEVERIVGKQGIRLKEIVQVPACPIATILREHTTNPIDFLSLDIESDRMMLSVLHAIPLTDFRPAVLCIETVTFDPEGKGRKNRALIDYLVGQGYAVYADTYINTIFVDPDRLPFQVDQIWPAGSGALVAQGGDGGETRRRARDGQQEKLVDK